MSEAVKSKKKAKWVLRVAVVLLVLLLSIAIVITGHRYYSTNVLIRDFAKEHRISIWEWPKELNKMLERNPETTSFVLHYPIKKDSTAPIDLGEYTDSDKVPLFLQWDERWGYDAYAGELMGLSGCGPTCLSMVCVYLLNDARYTPRYVAEFATANGYAVTGNGSAWTLISEGGEQFGLSVTELPLIENSIIQQLENGHPIICVVGPGDFTTTGHFIVLTEYKDGKVAVNDPNSICRSEMLWDLSSVMEQVRNLWACRVK